MSLPPTNVTSIQKAILRESANFHPAIWGDHFLTNDSTLSKTTDNSIARQKFEELKQQVRRMLTDAMDKPNAHNLRLIDAVERLGIAYHFKSELEHALHKIYNNCNIDEDDLYSTALRFRLLRQQGIDVSCGEELASVYDLDTFEKFKDNEGNFKAALTHDISGMLSLYEAAHLGIRGEDILAEAIPFTTTNLQSAVTHVSQPLAEQISRSLNRPIRKCLPRLEARYCISAYSREESHNGTLLQFAKLDFNILQGLHQKEVNDIMEWWKSLDITSKCPYARDRIVECYFWIMGVYFEPQYSLARKMLTKVIATLSILDDTYDNYGTTEELELFTEAIQRWDISAINELPECMKMIYHIMIDVYKEIEEDLAEERRSYCMNYAIEAMKKVVRFYLVEAKWREEEYVPTMDEYMHVSLMSSAYPTLVQTSILGMGDFATKEAFEWVSNDPKIVRASSIVCRLMDDIVGHEFEQERKHVASSVECYMKQYGVSEEEVVKLFREEIANAWKDINEECLKCSAVPMPVLERVLNFTRAIDVIYKDVDAYTNSYILKDCVASLLKDPVLL